MQKDGKKYNAEDKNILGHYTKEVGGDTQLFSQQKKSKQKPGLVNHCHSMRLMRHQNGTPCFFSAAPDLGEQLKNISVQSKKL